MRKRMYLWLCVTKDKYEFPIAIGDTVEELAEMCGVTKGSIYKSRAKAGERSKYKKVPIAED